MPNPCQSCGACCALYKVVVLTSETDNQPGGIVPEDLTVPSGKNKRLMKGTETFSKRCAALDGTVGAKVTCRVYEQRPSSCRNFPGSWEILRGSNPLCDRARAIYGMLPFESY